MLAITTGALSLSASAFSETLASISKPVPDIIQKSVLMGHASPFQLMHIAVSLKPRDAAAMQAFADSVSDPASPNYRHFITPTEFGEKFGASPADVSKVVAYLTANGFKIKLVADSRMNILADAYVSQVETAFGTTINSYHAVEPDAPGRINYFANSTKLQMPVSVAGNVLDISGTETFTKPKPRILTPTQTRVLYNTAPMFNKGLTGSGRTLAISNWDGYRLSNIPLYYAKYTLPTPTGGIGSNVTVVPIDGGAGAGAAGGEGDLDIQMVLGMAPLCKFMIYDGGGNLIDVLTQEANDNLADVISESYGWRLDANQATSAHNVHLQMTAQGITYMAATGDYGTDLEPFSYPNYEPEVLEVGGTVARVDASGKRTTEVAWSGSGSGWSTNTATFNKLPSWQKGPGVPTNINFRLNADVALHAADNDGAYYFFLDGKLTNGYDGTSFASPVFCGALGVAELQIQANGFLPPDKNGKRRLGRIQDYIYKQRGRSDIYFDILTGSTGSLPNGDLAVAGKGWDFCTGWGAIDFTAFANGYRTTVSESEPATDATSYIGVSPLGSAADLAVADGKGFSINSVSSSAGQVAGSVITVTTKSPASSLVGLSLKLVVIGKKTATNYVYLYNIKTNSYDLITGINLTGGSDTVTFDVPNITNYVNGNTIKILDRSLSPTRLSPTGFRLTVDQVVGTGLVLSN